jgi:hypothetical protein
MVMFKHCLKTEGIFNIEGWLAITTQHTMFRTEPQEDIYLKRYGLRMQELTKAQVQVGLVQMTADGD